MIAPFKVMALLARANELAQLGHDVIHLGVGEPDFATPAPIVSAGIEALESGATRYTDARGDLRLRQAIADYYLQSAGLSVSTDRIFVTAGASGGLLLLTALLMNPGENLLMTDPGYPCNRHFLSSFNADGLLVPVSSDTNYQLTPALVNQNWTDQTRGILVASPANPTGSILSSSALGALHASVDSKGGAMLSDEIYQGLCYGNSQAPSALTVSDEVFVVNSFSKYFGMTGWRLGWVVVPAGVTDALEKLAQNLFICASSIAQEAALAAFSDQSIAIMEQQRETLQARRDFLVPELRRLGFGVPTVPDGAFYVYAKLPEAVADAEAFCDQVLEQAFVAITPGTDFGFHEADRHVRISYAQDIDRLQSAISRIERLLP